jgi:hypothetical protein
MMTAPNFQNLTLTMLPVTTGNGTTLNSTLVSDATAGTTLIAGIIDPATGEKWFNPVAEGNAVVSGDNATKWLPVLHTFTAVGQVTDNLDGGVNQIGMVELYLLPAPANVVEVQTTMRVRVSASATVFTATGTF